MSDDELIKEVKDDDDLDMSTLGKPVAAFRPIPKATESQAASPNKPAGKGSSSKAKIKRELSKGTEAALWSQLDDEIADVSDDGLDSPTNEPLPTLDVTPKKNINGAANPPVSSSKRGIMPGGLSGGTSLGANAPLKEGPKDHSYGVEDGEARARVYDTPELRAAFLHYCKSNIKVSEMHLVHEGPFMAAQQFVQMCREYRLLEPEGGKLSLVMVGIIYTTSKSDEDEGLAFGQFLDSLVSLAFECETNVAGAMQAEWDKKDVLNKNKPENVLTRPPRNIRPTGKSISAAGMQDSEPSTAGGTGTSTPGNEFASAPALSRTISKCASKIMELLETEPPVPKPKKEGPKARFQTVETLTHSSVLDKVNAVSNIKSMATTRATSVINSRVTSRMVSRLPSRRASRDGFAEDEEEDDDDVDLNAKIGAAAAATAQGTGYQISPALLSKHMHAALNAYDDYVDDDVEPSPRSSLAGLPNRGKSILVQGPKGQPISPLFAVASHMPVSPGATSPGGGHTPGAAGLRPTTAARGRSLVASSAPSTSFRVLPDELVNKGFGSDDEEEEVDVFEKEITAKAKAYIQSKGTQSEGGAADSILGKPAMKSAMSKKVRNGDAFGSPVGSMRARFQSEGGALTASGSMADAAARAIAAVDAEMRSSMDGQQSVVSPKPPLATSKPAAGKPPMSKAGASRRSEDGGASNESKAAADPAAEKSASSAYEQKLAALEAKIKSKGAAAGTSKDESGDTSTSSSKPSKDKSTTATASSESAANALKSMLIDVNGKSAEGGSGAARQPMLIEKEDVALMASFGSGVAPAPATKKASKASNSGTAAANGEDTSKFDFSSTKSSKTADMAAKLAAIEQRMADGAAGGASGTAQAKPKPPAGPPPGAVSTSPRTSTTSSLKKVAAAEAKASGQQSPTISTA